MLEKSNLQIYILMEVVTMTDVFSKEKRSEVMSKIKGKDTKFEVMVRKWLFSKGFRFRKNDKRYPGKPDIFLSKHKTAIFIHGCFWHAHEGCHYAYTPKTRTDFWISKIQDNVNRDKRNYTKLMDMDIKVLIIWECELKKNADEILEKLVIELNKKRT